MVCKGELRLCEADHGMAGQGFARCFWYGLIWWGGAVRGRQGEAGL